MKNSFVFYADWWEVLSDMTDKARLKCFDAICRYAFVGELSTDPTTKAITGLMRSAIDRDAEKWEKAREQRVRAIQSRWDKVKGRNHTSVSTRNTKDTNVSTRNTKDTVNVNVNANANVNGSSKEEKDTNVSLSVSIPADTPYSKYLEWRKKECPHLSKMQEMTEKEFTTAIDVYGKKPVFDTLVAMENRRDTAKKNRTIYRTLRIWLNRNIKQEKGGDR